MKWPAISGQNGQPLGAELLNKITSNLDDISSNTVFATLGIGWAAFGLSVIFNILYNILQHPSQVTLITLICLHSFLLQVALLDITKKLVVTMLGYEINLVRFTKKGRD